MSIERASETSAGFPSIAGPVVAAAREGVPTIEINPDTTPLSDIVDVRLAMSATLALSAITERMKAAGSGGPA